MSKYEIVDMLTGEVMEFETKVDIDLLQEYNQWVVDQKLNPPSYTPQEYALYIEAETAKRQNKKAIEMIEKYQLGSAWHPDMIESLLRILKDEE